MNESESCIGDNGDQTTEWPLTLILSARHKWIYCTGLYWLAAMVKTPHVGLVITVTGQLLNIMLICIALTFIKSENTNGEFQHSNIWHLPKHFSFCSRWVMLGGGAGRLACQAWSVAHIVQSPYLFIKSCWPSILVTFTHKIVACILAIICRLVK